MATLKSISIVVASNREENPAGNTSMQISSGSDSETTFTVHLSCQEHINNDDSCVYDPALVDQFIRLLERMHHDSTVTVPQRESHQIVRGISTVSVESADTIHGNSTVLKKSDDTIHGNTVLKESDDVKHGNSKALRESDDTIHGNTTFTHSVTHDNTPFNILKTHTPVLLGIISDPDKLSDELWAKELLSDGVRDRIKTTLGISRYDKASMILIDVSKYLKILDSNDTFIQFCDVLINHGQPGLNKIAKKMIALLTD